MDISQTMTDAISSCVQALNLWKAAKDLMPDSQEKREADKALSQAEKSFLVAQSQVAFELGYNICQCSWPPPIALLQKDRVRRCPACGRDTDASM